MKKLVLLRTKLRDDIDWNKLDDIEDFYTLYARQFMKSGYVKQSEVWRQDHNPRIVEVEKNFYLRYANKFRDLKKKTPDMIFARGGFVEYREILKANRSAYKIYYGAGQRFYPKDGIKYDMVLVEDKEDKKFLEKQHKRKKITNIKVGYFYKSAVERIFHPMDMKKEYDIAFLGNMKQIKYKGQIFFWNVLKKLANKYRVVQIGNMNKDIIKFEGADKLNIDFVDKLPPENVNEYLNMSKIGVVCSNRFDGSPRIIQEYMASGLPIVKRKETRCVPGFINGMTGIEASDDDFANAISTAVDNYEKFKPHDWFKENLTIEKCVDKLWEQIGGASR